MFTYRKGVLFLIVIFLSSIIGPVINFVGNTSVYNISFALPPLVAFPSTFCRSCLTHIFFIHSLSLLSSFPQRVQPSSVLAQLFTLLGQSQLHYYWKYLALWLCLCIAYSRRCPKFSYHVMSDTQRINLFSNDMENFLRKCWEWPCYGWFKMTGKIGCSLEAGKKQEFLPFCPTKSQQYLSVPAFQKILVSFNFSYLPLLTPDSPKEAC